MNSEISLKKSENKEFFNVLIKIGIPMIIQSLILSSVNMIDTVMISSMGETEVVSVGIANQIFFLFNMAVAGFTSGGSIFISQYYGNKDYEGIKKVISISLIAILIFNMIFFIPAFFVPKIFITLFSTDNNVIEIATQYFRIIAFSYPLTGISMLFAVASRSIRNTKLGLISSVSAIALNLILNYCLIFGKFIFPELGVKGAAISTVIARFVEMLILLIYIYVINKDSILKISIYHIKKFELMFFKLLIHKSAPIFLNDFIWGIGCACYMVAYSKAGTEALAAIQITSTASNFFIILIFAISSSSCIILGNELGAGNTEKAVNYSRKFAKTIFALSITLGLALILSTPILTKIFSISKESIDDVRYIFIIMGILMPLKAGNGFLVGGLLRSGGDTKYSLVIGIISMWLISIPITMIGALKGAPIYILVLLTYTEELSKIIFLIKRALSKKWIVNITK